MSNIETGVESGESKKVNAHRLRKAGVRIAGATLALTGIGFGGISEAATPKTHSVSEVSRPVTNPNLVHRSEHREIARDRSITFANYNEAASAGNILPKGAEVFVDCVATDQEGNKWYLIIRPQKRFAGYWDAANNFDNGYTGGTVVEAPTVDSRVPACPEPYEPVPAPTTTLAPQPVPTPTTTTSTTLPPKPAVPSTTPTTTPSTRSETVGSVAHTWTNYVNASGTEGPSIADHETVQISCKVEGWTGPDGNNWWYRVESSPWNNDYYVSADAFYNNGATSGSLIGTAFEDPSVPNC